MTNSFLLAAGVDVWVKLIVPIVVILLYAINHLIQAGKAANTTARKPPQRRPANGGERPLRPPQQQAPRQQAAQKPANPSQLGAEIEQFLKRAGERRGEKARREPSLTSPPRPLSQQQPVDVMPLEQADFSSVSASVEKHMANRGFTERAEHLADDIVRADEQMEQHMKDTFGRRVGTLDNAGPKSAPATDTVTSATGEQRPVAATLAAFLANPSSLGQLVVLKEIIDRPEHRW